MRVLFLLSKQKTRTPDVVYLLTPMNLRFALLSLIVILGMCTVTHAQQVPALTTAEKAWLTSHDNTIVVYPQAAFIPSGSEDTNGKPQGVSVEYLDLIAKKMGITLRYLPARPLLQIFDEIQEGKGDVVPAVAQTKNRSKFLVFTDSYLTIPTVIVQRNDRAVGDTSLDDLAGKKVAVSSGHAIQEYIQDYYPRIVLVPVNGDELGLQKVLLGEVTAIVMDATSLSKYLARQTTTSLKVVGTTDFQYHLAFASTKDNDVVRSILDKGLASITTSERTAIEQKWKPIPLEDMQQSTILDRYKTLGIVLGSIVVLLFLLKLLFMFQQRQLHRRYIHTKKLHTPAADAAQDLSEEKELLIKELEDIQHLEESIQEKLEKIT